MPTNDDDSHFTDLMMVDKKCFSVEEKGLFIPNFSLFVGFSVITPANKICML